MAGPKRGRSLARDDTGPGDRSWNVVSSALGRAPESIQKDDRPRLWDEEIRERVKIPVDERLGGCRGFKSHRPHQQRGSNLDGEPGVPQHRFCSGKAKVSLDYLVK
jgi:hypothetical protein